MNSPIAIGLTLTSVVCTATLSSYAENRQEQPTSFEHYLYKQPRPLALDVMRIAILQNRAESPESAAVLARAGIDSQQMQDWVLDWRLAPAPLPHRSPEGIAQLVDELAEQSGHFISPVFVDDFGGPMIILQDVFVRFNADVAEDEALAILSQIGNSEILERNWAKMSNTYRLRFTSRNALDVLAAANQLALRDEVRFAEPEFMFTGRKAKAGFPDDPLFANQWGMHNEGQYIGAPCDFEGALAEFDIDAPEAWEISTGHESIIIVIIDDGVQLDHPDLMIDPALGADFTGEGGGGYPMNACDSHGTRVAGPAGALWNGVGIVGLVSSCKLASARPFVSTLPAGGCDGQWTTPGGASVLALAWAEEIGARVTNNSNGYSSVGAALIDKYAETYANGMIHFASAGNAGLPQITLPASLPSVNAIANVGPKGMLNPTSNYGEGLAFCAPGAVTVTTDRTGPDGDPGDFTCAGGTSFSSPHAAGVAALIISKNPLLPAAQVENIMQQSATDVGPVAYDTTYGWGLVNAHMALLLTPIPADITGNGVVDVDDLLAVINAWGPCANPPPGDCPADIAPPPSGDDVVNVDDLLMVINNWG